MQQAIKSLLNLKNSIIKQHILVIFIIVTYAACYVLTHAMGGEYFLIAGEHLTTNAPEILIENMTKWYDWNRQGLIRSSDLPRGMHQGLINNLVFYSFAYVGAIIGLNATAMQLFFGLLLQAYGLWKIFNYCAIDKKKYSIAIYLILAVFLNFQNFDLVLGGGFYWINFGLLLTSLGTFFAMNSFHSLRNGILFVIASSMFFYSGIVWINPALIIALVVVVCLILWKRKIFYFRTFIALGIVGVICYPYAREILNDPISPYYYAYKQNFIFAISSGFVKGDLHFFGNAFDSLLEWTIATFIIAFLAIHFRNNKTLTFFYAIIVLWQVTSLGDLIARHLILFQNFRATYKLAVVTDVILIIIASRSLWTAKRIWLIKVFLGLIIFYLALHWKDYLVDNVPKNYFEVQHYANGLEGKKLLFPYSRREDFIRNTYTWKKSNTRDEYPSNVFATIAPLKNIFDVDEVDNPSRNRLDFMIASETNNANLFYDLMVDNDVKYVINDKNKVNNSIFINFRSEKFRLMEEFDGIEVYRLVGNGDRHISSLDINAEKLKRIFLRENLNVIGLSDFVDDYSDLRNFAVNSLNTIYVFQFDPKLARTSDVCFVAPTSLKGLMIYSNGNIPDTFAYIGEKTKLTLIPNIKYSHGDIGAYDFPRNDFDVKKFCFNYTKNGKIFFKLY